MSQGRDSGGRFEKKIRDQDILKIFDYAEDPMLTVTEIADGLQTHFDIGVTSEAVRQRLKDMEEKDLVASKDFGARATGWRALVAPELSDATAATVDERRELDRDEFVGLDE